jgi:hypothetical protein
MRAAARSLPQPTLDDWALAGPPCRLLTGARFVHQTIFCAKSFEWACRTRVKLEIFDDGTLKPAHIAQLQRSFPHATIQTEPEVTARLDRVLPSSLFPHLRRMRDEQPLMRKLLDMRAGLSGPSLYLDSDMLFFATPVRLRDWLHHPAGSFFMPQPGNGLVDTRENLRLVFDQEILPGVNGGILAFDDDGVDWRALELAASRLAEPARMHKWAEQTLHALLLSQQKATPLPEADYVLCSSRADLHTGVPVLRHYIHKAKACYTASEWRLWLARGPAEANVQFELKTNS